MKMQLTSKKTLDVVADENTGPCGLIPWLLNGTLEPGQVRELEAHLPSCTRCREGLEIWRTVQNQRLNEIVHINDVEAGLAKMNQRLDRYLAGSSARPSDAAARRSLIRPSLSRQKMFTNFAVAATVLVVTGVYLHTQPLHANLDARYVTLSDKAPTAAVAAQQYQFRVLFHRDTTDARMQAIFNQFDAQVIAGPTAKGVYTVTVPVATMEPREITEALRREPEVLVAEWINSL